MDRRAWLIAAAAAAGLAADTTPPALAADPTSASRRIDRIAAGLVRPGEPGLMLTILHGDEVVHAKGYGYVDRKAQRPANRSTRFHLGSVGKQFTAIGVLLLVQDGLVDLDAPLARYLPELARLHPTVTARHVLQHLSGLPSCYPEESEAGFAVLRRVIAARRGRRAVNADVAPTLGALPALAPPGVVWAYSNSGYDLLGGLIERVSGQSFASFFRRRVFTPLGMNGAFVAGDPKLFDAPDVARGHAEAPGTPPGGRRFVEIDPARDSTRLMFDALSGSGGIVASSNDMVAYARAWNRDMPILRRDLLRQMTIPATGAAGGLIDPGTGFGYGLGIEIVRDVIPSARTNPAAKELLDRAGVGYLHNGAWPGYTASFARLPRRRVSVVLLLARDAVLGDLEAIWRRPIADIIEDAPRVAGASIKLAVDLARPWF